MTSHLPVAIVTLLALLLYLVMGMRVGRARGLYKIAAPAVTGHPDFERSYRVQMNTLEWLPLFVASLWLFALYWNEWAAVVLGAIWIIGRLLYMLSYSRDAATRGPGFLIQGLAALALLLGALGRVVYLAVAGG